MHKCVYMEIYVCVRVCIYTHTRIHPHIYTYVSKQCLCYICAGVVEIDVDASPE